MLLFAATADHVVLVTGALRRDWWITSSRPLAVWRVRRVTWRGFTLPSWSVRTARASQWLMFVARSEGGHSVR